MGEPVDFWGTGRGGGIWSLYAKEGNTVERFVFGRWLKVMHDPIQSRAALGMLGPKHVSDAEAAGSLHALPAQVWSDLRTPAGIAAHCVDPDAKLYLFINAKDREHVVAGDWTQVEARVVALTRHNEKVSTSPYVVEWGELVHKSFGAFVASPKHAHYDSRGAALKALSDKAAEVSDELAGEEAPISVAMPLHTPDVQQRVSDHFDNEARARREEARREAEAARARLEALKTKPAAALDDTDFAERMRRRREVRDHE